MLDTKSERIVRAPAGLGELAERGRVIAQLLHADLPWWLLLLGLAGLGVLARRRRPAAFGLATAAVVYVAVSVIVWEGRVSDALLAVKLPAVWACALGLAFLVPRQAPRWATRHADARPAAGAWLGYRHRAAGVAVTRDRTYEGVVHRVAQLLPQTGHHGVVPWGHDYWALRYVSATRAPCLASPSPTTTPRSRPFCRPATDW